MKENDKSSQNEESTSVWKALIKPFFAAVEWEDWCEDGTRCKEIVALNASTYKPSATFDLPPGFRHERHYQISPQGNFAYRNDLLRAFQPLEHFHEPGYTIWNGEVVLPKLIDMNRHCHDGNRFKSKTSEYKRAREGAIWMSLTPRGYLRIKPCFFCSEMVVRCLSG